MGRGGHFPRSPWRQQAVLAPSRGDPRGSKRGLTFVSLACACCATSNPGLARSGCTRPLGPHCWVGHGRRAARAGSGSTRRYVASLFSSPQRARGRTSLAEERASLPTIDRAEVENPAVADVPSRAPTTSRRLRQHSRALLSPAATGWSPAESLGVATAPARIGRGCCNEMLGYGLPTVAHQASAEGADDPDLMYREPKRFPIAVNPR
jgi:hypothetical protein